jgi:membrane protein required for colicin V production
MFGISWFDIAAFVILVLSGVMAFARGLIREVFSIIALIGAGIAAIFLAGRVAPLIEGLTPVESGVLAWLTGGLLVFLVVFLVLTIIISVVAKTAHQSAEIGAFDRAGGAFFGVVRGILVVALFLVLMRQVTGSPAVSPQAVMPAQITRAWSYPGFEAVAIALERIFPGARQLATDYIRGRQRESAPIPPAAAPASTPEPAPAAPEEPKAASKKG